MTIGVEQLKTWSFQLSRGTGNAAQTAAALGLSGALAQHGDYWDVTPPPAGTRGAKLVERGDRIDYVEILLALPVSRGALDVAFGEGREIPRSAPFRPYHVAYHVEVAGAPHTCELIAGFDEEPTTPTAAASRIVLRCDRA